jgi:4a-hydroxytetrahydrobiopterin dehydratase
MELHEKRCEPCRGGVPPLTLAELAPLLAKIEGWKAVDGHHLEKSWQFADFASALTFVHAVGVICEDQGHHANFEFGWGEVLVRTWTHKIDGLAEADFILAAKIDQIAPLSPAA